MAKSGAQDDLLSLNEKNFLLDALNAGRRVDGRGFYDYRTLRIVFGTAPGCVQIQLGQTKYEISPQRNISLYTYHFHGIIVNYFRFSRLPAELLPSQAAKLFRRIKTDLQKDFSDSISNFLPWHHQLLNQEGM